MGQTVIMNNDSIKIVLGLELGSNSVGWALLREHHGRATKIIALGVRIFSKAVEDQTPIPKNKERRDKRLGRRVLQRHYRRKQRMLNYLISLDLLPRELQGHTQPEILLNAIGDPYELRAKGLDEPLRPHELGRVLLRFVARRGFLSSKKQLAGDLIDDPDTLTYLESLDKGHSKDKEESQFKQDIAALDDLIHNSDARPWGNTCTDTDQKKATASAIEARRGTSYVPAEPCIRMS